MIKEITNENFELEVTKSDIPVLVDFWAPWCGPCRMISPVLEALAQEHAGRLKVVKVNVDEAPELAAQFGIMSIPALFCYRDGAKVAEYIGVTDTATIRGALG